MIDIGVAFDTDLTPEATLRLKAAREIAVPNDQVRFISGTDIGFGVPGVQRTLSVDALAHFPGAPQMVAAAMMRHLQIKPILPDNTLFLDIETHSADDRWNMSREDFFRLGQWAWNDEDVQTTTRLDETLDLIRSADLVIAHNGHPFDFSVLLGDEALNLAYQRKLLDTMALANLVFYTPTTFTTRQGHTFYNADKPFTTMKWLGLDNLCYQLGLPGKMGDLDALAKKYGGYGAIPQDDPQYLKYAVQDIHSLRGLTYDLLNVHPMSEYDWREQFYVAINAQIARNGFAVDKVAAQARYDELQVRKAQLLGELNAEYDFPTEGAMPWRSKVGKQAIFDILADSGITPSTVEDWPLTKTGNLSLSGDAMIQVTEDSPAAELGLSLAEVMGQRPLAAQALAYCQNDGLVHPEFGMFQRSGRTSVTKPGLTTWSSRDKEKASEKAYFVARPGYKLVEFDYSQADARIVAALSGDREFAHRFDEGVDAHELTGRMVFDGSKIRRVDEDGETYFILVPSYDEDPHKYRQLAKVQGHAYSYRAGARKLAWAAKVPLEIAEKFVMSMRKAYRKMTQWQDQMYEEAKSGFVTNPWGRRMAVTKGKEYTQGPALQGQSGTREIMGDGLIRLYEAAPRLILCVKATVHDAIVMELPEATLDADADLIMACMSTTLHDVEFTLSRGPAADTWQGCDHS